MPAHNLVSPVAVHMGRGSLPASGAQLPPELLPRTLAFTPRAPRGDEPGDPDFPEALRIDGLDRELPRVAFYSSRPEHYLVLAAIYGEPAAAAVWWAARVDHGTVRQGRKMKISRRAFSPSRIAFCTA